MPVRYRNHLKKPGPAFNYMTQLAYVDGADWLYRINDDTYFMSHVRLVLCEGAAVDGAAVWA